jgi:hypothetical protein
VAKYVEFPLEGGGSILIEAAEEPARSPSGFLRSGPGEGAAAGADKAQASFDASVESVRRSAELLVAKLRSLSVPPDELEIAFNLKAAGDLGMAISKAGSDANFAVTLKWRSSAAKGGDAEGDRQSRRQPSKLGAQAMADAVTHQSSQGRRRLPAETPVEPDVDDDDEDDEDDV